MTRARALASLLALIPMAAFAQASGNVTTGKGHNGNAPVDVTSDRIEVQDKANRAVFVGNVHAVQGDMVMDSQRMTVAYSRANQPNSDPQIERIDASGGVTVVQPNQRAKGNYGIYDLNRRLITLIGNVTITQNGNTVNGARVVINQDTGKATLDGSAVAGGSAGGTTTSSGGRVTGRFTVPQRTQAQPANGQAGTAPKK